MDCLDLLDCGLRIFRAWFYKRNRCRPCAPPAGWWESPRLPDCKYPGIPRLRSSAVPVMPPSFLIESKIILDRDRRQRLGLPLDLDAFLWPPPASMQPVRSSGVRTFKRPVFSSTMMTLFFLHHVLNVLDGQAVRRLSATARWNGCVAPWFLYSFCSFALASSRFLGSCSAPVSTSCNAVPKSGNMNASGSLGLKKLRPFFRQIGLVAFLINRKSNSSFSA